MVPKTSRLDAFACGQRLGVEHTACAFDQRQHRCARAGGTHARHRRRLLGLGQHQRAARRLGQHGQVGIEPWRGSRR